MSDPDLFFYSTCFALAWATILSVFIVYHSSQNEKIKDRMDRIDDRLDHVNIELSRVETKVDVQTNTQVEKVQVF